MVGSKSPHKSWLPLLSVHRGPLYLMFASVLSITTPLNSMKIRVQGSSVSFVSGAHGLSKRWSKVEEDCNTKHGHL